MKRLILCFLISFSFLNASSITKIPDKNIKDELQRKIYNEQNKDKVIEENKTYPRAAKRLNQRGKLHISFVISKDGQIRNAKIVRDSSYAR